MKYDNILVCVFTEMKTAGKSGFPLREILKQSKAILYKLQLIWSFPPALSAFSWQGMFFIYFRVISHELVSGSL